MKRRTEPSFETSTGNVFTDLGFEHPEEELAKAQLVLQIVELVRARPLTQGQAAALLGLPQPKVSLLLRGQTRGFSTGRLIRFLNRLGQNVDIVVSAKTAAQSKARVRVVRKEAVPASNRRHQAQPA